MGISRDQVIWCYRTLLRRDPESEEVIAEAMEHRDRADLILRIIGSEEFKGMDIDGESNG